MHLFLLFFGQLLTTPIDKVISILALLFLNLIFTTPSMGASATPVPRQPNFVSTILVLTPLGLIIKIG